MLSLTAEQMGVMTYEIPDGEELQRLSPAVRQLVLEYFERLNRARPGGGGSAGRGLARANGNDLGYPGQTAREGQGTVSFF